MARKKSNYQQYYTSAPEPVRSKKRHWLRRIIFGAALVVISVGVVVGLNPQLRNDLNPLKPAKKVVLQTTPAAKTPQKSSVSTSTTSTPPPASACMGNTLSQFIIVSISERHLWACTGTSQLYDSPVVTGMENLAADLTPTGTYHIYAKETNLYLKGSDSTGSWNDYVYYWMPFLSNQYGVYGFHDATWRAADAFGKISPYSTDASHGCVELPLATAKWLYNWAVIGTTLQINS